MADPRIKTLRIKTGIVKRLAKEKVMYEKDADAQRKRIQKFKDEGKKCTSFSIKVIFWVCFSL
jgi:tubulin-specific chaperone A